LGLLYILPTALFKFSPMLWQIFAIIGRWLFTISVYGFLNKLWPRKKEINKFIVLLFLIYPGFSQQWISVIYSHIFLVFAFYFFSLKIFIGAIRDRPKSYFFLTVISIGLSLFCMTAVEYVVGLEILRPLIIYKLLKSKSKKNDPKGSVLLQSFRLWLPYLISGFSFIIYRLFFAESVLYSQQIIPEESSTLLYTVSNIVFTQFENVLKSIFSAWGSIINPLLSINFLSKIDLIYLGLIVLYFLIAFLLSRRLNSGHEQILNSNWIYEALIGSSIMLLAVGLPFAAANLKPGIEFPSDRFLLPFMLGSAVILFFAIGIFYRRKAVFSIIFSLIFALGAAFQFSLADTYRKDWILFKDFFQQFTWRVPSIEENTLFITNDLPLKHYSDNSLTAPLNWIYAADGGGFDMPYLINFTDIRLGNSLSALAPGEPVYHPYRTFTFKGSTNQSVFFYFNPPGCFHIVDPDIDKYNPLISDTIRFNLDLSNSSLLHENTKQNSAFFLDNKPKISWCYYYQKASLAAQDRNWSLVVELGEKAFSLNDYPNDASERIPFIEAFAMTGNVEKAIEQSQIIHSVSELYDPMLCALWNRICSIAEFEASELRNIQSTLKLIHCQIDKIN